MGTPKPALRTVLEAGELLCCTNILCEIVQLGADSARVRVLDLVVCDCTLHLRQYTRFQAATRTAFSIPTHHCE